MPRASDAEAELFIDDAIEALVAMESTCSLDLADQGSSGKRRIGRALGTSPQAATQAVTAARESMNRAAQVAGIIDADLGSGSNENEDLACFY